MDIKPSVTSNPVKVQEQPVKAVERDEDLDKEYVDKLVAPTDLVQGEKDDTFSNCTKLVGTVTTADGEEVTAYNANNVGGTAARVYLTYSTIVENN